MWVTLYSKIFELLKTRVPDANQLATWLLQVKSDRYSVQEYYKVTSSSAVGGSLAIAANQELRNAKIEVLISNQTTK